MKEIKLKKLFLPLTMVFIIFKITAVVDWSWWGVFSPVFALAVVELTYYIIAIIFIFYSHLKIRRDLKEKKREINEEIMERVARAKQTIEDES